MTEAGRAERAAGSRGRCRDDGGAAMVEFAFVLPILAMLLFGIISGGLLLNQKQSLTYAAREGARYGAALPQTTANWATTVQDVTVARSDGDLVASQVCVALIDNNGAVVSGKSTGGAPCFSDGCTNCGFRVQVRVTRPGNLNAAIVQFPVTLTSQAVASFENNQP